MDHPLLQKQQNDTAESNFEVLHVTLVIPNNY